MRLKPRILAGLIILFLFLAMIPPVSGNGWPEEQTRHIQAPPPALGKDNDMFVTEAGIGHHGPLVTVLDPNMDIYGYLFFRDIKLNSYFYLENATLRLRTASTLDFDAESSFTIYGINDYIYFGMWEWGYGSPGEIMSAPLTSANVPYNSSEFYGPQWWEIDVTNIVQELKSNPWYEGPGLDFNDPGDYMAFIILGAGGPDSRWFYDLSAGNGYEAQLHLHWDFSPPPPEGYEEATFNETYGNYTIWTMPGAEGALGYPLEPIEYLFRNGSEAPYNVEFGDISNNASSIINSTLSATEGIISSSRTLVRIDNGTLFAVYEEEPDTKHAWVSRSLDNGITWGNEKEIGSELEGNRMGPSIAVDSKDGLHLVFFGDLSVQIWYSYLNTTEPGASWTNPIDISIPPCSGQQLNPAIAVDSDDVLHVVWKGRSTGFPTLSQIWYSNYTDSWGTPLRISTALGMDADYQEYASIAVDSENHIHVAFLGQVLANDEVYYVGRETSWETPVKISTLPNMDNAPQGIPSIAVDSDDVPHVVFAGKGDPFFSHYQIYETNYSDSWSDPLRISTRATMEDYDHLSPTIAVDSNDILHVTWEGTIAGMGAEPKGWYANETSGLWSDPNIVQIDGTLRYFNLRWARWPVAKAPGDSTFIVVDANGTVLVEDLETLDDAEDWIDDVDPDPEDPDPGGLWSEGPGGATGPFTRFKIRLYFLILGFGCVFGPVLFFSWRRPTGYYLMVGAIIMIMGLGLLLAIGDI